MTNNSVREKLLVAKHFQLLSAFVCVYIYKTGRGRLNFLRLCGFI
jgi:hypothetical protein